MICEKRCYGSPQEARRANRRNHKRLRIYYCPVCHAYHTTTQSKHHLDRLTPPYKRSQGDN